MSGHLRETGGCGGPYVRRGRARSHATCGGPPKPSSVRAIGSVSDAMSHPSRPRPLHPIGHAMAGGSVFGRDAMAQNLNLKRELYGLVAKFPVLGFQSLE